MISTGTELQRQLTLFSCVSQSLELIFQICFLLTLQNPLYHRIETFEGNLIHKLKCAKCTMCREPCFSPAAVGNAAGCPCLFGVLVEAAGPSFCWGQGCKGPSSPSAWTAMPSTEEGTAPLQSLLPAEPHSARESWHRWTPRASVLLYSSISKSIFE